MYCKRLRSLFLLILFGLNAAVDAQQEEWAREVFRETSGTSQLQYTPGANSIYEYGNSIYVQGAIGSSIQLNPYSSLVTTIYRDSLHQNKSNSLNDIYISQWNENFELQNYATILLPNATKVAVLYPYNNEALDILYYPIVVRSDSINVGNGWEDTKIVDTFAPPNYGTEQYTAILKYTYNLDYISRLEFRDANNSVFLSNVFAGESGYTYVSGMFRDSLWVGNNLVLAANAPSLHSFVIKLDIFDNVVWAGSLHNSRIFNAFYNKYKNRVELAASVNANFAHQYSTANQVTADLFPPIGNESVMLLQLKGDSGKLLGNKYIRADNSYISSRQDYFGNDSFSLLTYYSNSIDSFIITGFTNADTSRLVSRRALSNVDFSGARLAENTSRIITIPDKNGNWTMVNQSNSDIVLDLNTNVKLSDYDNYKAGYHNRFMVNYDIKGNLNHAWVYPGFNTTFDRFSDIKVLPTKEENGFYLISATSAPFYLGVGPRSYFVNPVFQPDYFISKYNCKPTAYFKVEAEKQSIICKNLSTSECLYQWSFNGEGSSDSVNGNFIFTADGKKKIRLIATNSCGKDTFEQEVDIIKNSTNQFSIDDMKLSPNPSFGLVKLTGTVIKNERFQVNIYNLQGQNVYDNNFIGENNFISLLNLSSGLYIVKVSMDNGYSKSFKLIKQN